MPGTLTIDDGTFIEQRGTVPVGEHYRQFVYDGGRQVSVGDYVYFDDPDTGMHVEQCPLVLNHEFIGYVKTVYARDPSYGDEGIHPEVGSTSPLGRLDVSDSYVCIVPSAGPVGHRGEPLPAEAWGVRADSAVSVAKTLHASKEYSKHYDVERHGGWGAIGEPEAVDIGACSECQENEFGPNYTDGA